MMTSEALTPNLYLRVTSGRVKRFIDELDSRGQVDLKDGLPYVVRVGEVDGTLCCDFARKGVLERAWFPKNKRSPVFKLPTDGWSRPEAQKVAVGSPPTRAERALREGDYEGAAEAILSEVTTPMSNPTDRPVATLSSEDLTVSVYRFERQLDSGSTQTACYRATSSAEPLFSMTYHSWYKPEDSYANEKMLEQFKSALSLFKLIKKSLFEISNDWKNIDDPYGFKLEAPGALGSKCVVTIYVGAALTYVNPALKATILVPHSSLKNIDTYAKTNRKRNILNFFSRSRRGVSQIAREFEAVIPAFASALVDPERAALETAMQTKREFARQRPYNQDMQYSITGRSRRRKNGW